MLTGQFHVGFWCSKHPEASTMPRCRHRIRTPAHCRLKLCVQSDPLRLGTSTGMIFFSQNNLTLKWLHHVTCKGCKRCPVTRRSTGKWTWLTCNGQKWSFKSYLICFSWSTGWWHSWETTFSSTSVLWLILIPETFDCIRCFVPKPGPSTTQVDFRFASVRISWWIEGTSMVLVDVMYRTQTLESCKAAVKKRPLSILLV